MDNDGLCKSLEYLLGDDRDIWVDLQDLDNTQVCVRVSGEAEWWNGAWHCEEKHIGAEIVGIRMGGCDQDIQRDSTLLFCNYPGGVGGVPLAQFFARWWTDTMRQATSQVPQLINRVEA